MVQLTVGGDGEVLRPPPRGTRCDAHLGWRTDTWGKPVAVSCGKLATETRRDPHFGWEIWLCAGCALVLDLKTGLEDG